MADRDAVVIGGGIGGLLAAGALAEHCRQVTVVERDRYPEEPDHRSGAPQSHHAHVLMPRGAELVAKLFPGITDELRADGAAVVGTPRGGRVVSPAGPLPLPPPAGQPLQFSRFLLEWRLRRRLAGLGRVRFAENTEVVGLDAAGDGSRVGGVRVRGRDRAGSEVISADLVVDASGRNSKADRWLAGLGYGPVPEESVNSGLGYASRFYRLPAGFPDELAAVLVNPRPPANPTAALLLALENGTWHLTLAGVGGTRPPTDEAGFQAYAARVADPWIARVARVGEPLGPIRGRGVPTNRLRRYERLPRWPAGFVVTADAVAAFNPIYGQGMTVAALGAVTLGECLAARPAGFERLFQRRLARALTEPWLVACTEDLRWPGVILTGARARRGSGLARRYFDAVLREAVHSPALAARYFAAITMTTSLRTLFGPATLARVARHLLLNHPRG